jgi:hypothetical protein
VDVFPDSELPKRLVDPPHMFSSTYPRLTGAARHDNDMVVLNCEIRAARAVVLDRRTSPGHEKGDRHCRAFPPTVELDAGFSTKVFSVTESILVRE